MSADLTDLIRMAWELPDEDRATLAVLLIESLDAEPREEVEQAWAEEIRRRLADLDSGAVESVPWGTVRARLRKRLRGRSTA